MKRSILLAASVSILLSGCLVKESDVGFGLVKKSEFVAERTAHEAVNQELMKINEELVNTAAKLKAETASMSRDWGSLVSLRAELDKSRAALAAAQKAVGEMKADSADSSKRALLLASQLRVAQQKADEASRFYRERSQQFKTKSESEIAELKAKNDELRQFMLTNYASADFKM